MARPRTARPEIREAEVRPEPAREPVRIKQRTRKGVGNDKLRIPDEILAMLWNDHNTDLQWNVTAVLGKPEAYARSSMARQGWEPVTGDMWDGLFDGMFMPRGHRGEIEVEGLVLEWRPKELTLEARAEELQAARHARHAEESKLRAGAVDGVDPNILTNDDPKARSMTFLRKERVPSMPVPQ